MKEEIPNYYAIEFGLRVSGFVRQILFLKTKGVLGPADLCGVHRHHEGP